MELVTSARVVYLSRPRVADIPHVCDLIASCLAPPKSWTIENAIRHGCARLVRHLLDELADNPEPHYLVNRLRARRYLSVAASMGNLMLMEHLVERFGCRVDGSPVREAVEGGHLEAQQWLYDRALTGLAPSGDTDAVKKKMLPNYCMIVAGRIGHLEMLQWLHNITKPASVDQVLRDAINSGHLHILEWVLPMVKIPMPNSTKLSLTEAVTRSGSLDAVKLLHSKLLLPLTSGLMDAAAWKGQLELLQWMYDNGGEGCTSRAIDYAAIDGDFDAVQWLHSKGLGCSASAMNGAAQKGHLAVVKFLHENRSERCTPEAFKSAVSNNHLDVAQYLFEHQRGDCTDVSMDEVAGEGGLEMLKWLQINCPDAECTVDAMDAAARNGHLEVVQFLHENRSEGCTTTAIDEAAENGHLEIVQFLHENRVEGCTVDAVDRAVKYGHLDVVKFLHENRIEGCTTDAMDNAHNLEILWWLGENRRESFTIRGIHISILNGDLEKLLWLRNHTPAEMWTPMLLKTSRGMPSNGRVEMLEWLTTTFPALLETGRWQEIGTDDLGS